MATGPRPTRPRPEFSGEKPFLLGAGAEAEKTRILNAGVGRGRGRGVLTLALPRPILLKLIYYPSN
jgi:hypothetical protein